MPKNATRTVDGKEINMLVFHLHTLFEHISSTGDFPAQFEVSALTPIMKGDVRDMGKYRGLPYQSAVPWLRCMLSCLRTVYLSLWGEGNKACSLYQAGFWKNRGTVHNIFCSAPFVGSPLQRFEPITTLYLSDRF
ncbi:hypothetical protein Vafri_11254 [Volvox africanus]|nr:hypothetical protein Vafri_11254 [Volvox africanus]